MSNCPFCNLDPAPHTVQPSGALHRAWRSIQWLVPATVLMLIPKCPLCVAAYVALFTGIGITVSTARCIQVLMLAISLTSLAYLAVRHRRRRANPVMPPV
jgi:hypothetical protein